jgi:hypothetical protein
MPPSGKSLAAKLKEKRKRAFQEHNEAVNEAADPTFFSAQAASVVPLPPLVVPFEKSQAFHAPQFSASDNVVIGDGLDLDPDLEVCESIHLLFMYATVS